MHYKHTAGNELNPLHFTVVLRYVRSFACIVLSLSLLFSSPAVLSQVKEKEHGKMSGTEKIWPAIICYNYFYS